MRIEDKVARLRDPGIYPERPAVVEVVETHFSWVFLTERLVYKLKKPVRYHGLDFTTLAARRRNCEREVALNRRLAPDVYLGTLALTASDGTAALGGAGAVLDWLVVMRRLPAGRMLDAAIRAGTVGEAEIRKFTGLLAAFYRRTRPAPLAPAAYRQRFALGIADNRTALLASGTALPHPMIDALYRWQHGFLRRHRALLDARAGRLVDAHGDLRPEHICLTPEPAIIDCLEFDPELRRLDPADELSYLALECERLGAGQIGDRVLAHYAATSGDHCPDPLLRFYRVFRACLRAKIAVWHLADCTAGEGGKWTRRALDYLHLAERHARGPQ
jgi:uncharacterized protein